MSYHTHANHYTNKIPILCHTTLTLTITPTKYQYYVIPHSR